METTFAGAGQAVPLLARQLLFLLFVLLAFLSLSACGRKGNPVPPEEVVYSTFQASLK